MSSDTSISNTSQSLSIGEFFTPIKWGQFAIQQFNLLEKWLNGATIYDPTMGEGHLLQALISEALSKKNHLSNLPLHTLHGSELKSVSIKQFLKRIHALYGINLPKGNFICEDILACQQEHQFDIILSNPPWLNFVDLPTCYKPFIKDKFLQYGLVENKQKTLWGGARMDIACLIIQKTIADNLKPKGQAIYFTPLSILLNEGAHACFRNYNAGGINFCIEAIYDFADADIFKGVATRYGLLNLRKNKKQQFPIDYKIYKNNTCKNNSWQKYFARPSLQSNSALRILKNKSTPIDKPITIPKESCPRQGINSCGANAIYFFNELKNHDPESYLLANKSGEALLPRQYIYPVLSASNFKSNNKKIHKWVFLPYNKTGKALSLEQVMSDKILWNYLKSHEQALRSRKGVIIGSFIKRNLWWALLGVGPYNFARYKIAWEAYGRNHFVPRLFNGTWQANQSLQAFIPLNDKPLAQRILSELNDGRMQDYLASSHMGGTMSWAQPSRVKNFLILK